LELHCLRTEKRETETANGSGCNAESLCRHASVSLNINHFLGAV